MMKGDKTMDCKKVAGADSGQAQNVNGVGCSVAAEGAELVSAPTVPGWPSAEPQKHGWPSQGVGAPWEATHDLEFEN